MNKERIHVYPVNDTRGHNTNGEYCRCQPTIEDSGASVLVIHNAFDAREFFEQGAATLESELRRRERIRRLRLSPREWDFKDTRCTYGEQGT